MDDDKKKDLKLQIYMDEDVAQGTYINLSMVNHTEHEFTFDFIYVQPQQPKGKVRARIISSPKHTKRFLMALQENLKKYEEKFGKVEFSAASESITKTSILH
jgi:hypothetical protein